MKKEKNLKNFIKNVKFNNVMCAIGKITTFILIEITLMYAGLYIFNNCITTIK